MQFNTTLKRKTCQALVGLALTGLSLQAMAATGTITLCDEQFVGTNPFCTQSVQTVTSTVNSFFNTYISGKTDAEIQENLPWYRTEAGLFSWSNGLRPFVWLLFDTAGNPLIAGSRQLLGRLSLPQDKAANLTYFLTVQTLITF
jgi:hypothetical protein